jgi:2-polyprenyl-6-methoxyphenol hydroxylase-like FAD-dependent oxidoreductase
MRRPAERVLVVGGGPAGLALAAALAANGVEPDLVELKKELRAPGAALTLLGPAIRALDSLGIADEAIAAGFPRARMLIGNHIGQVRAVIDTPELPGSGRPGAIGITRPALHDVLVDAVHRAGVEPRLGVTVSSLVQRADCVEVELSDGTSGTYDLVAAADGIHSQLRELLFADVPKPRFTGQGVWRALVDRPPDFDDAGMYYGPRNKAGINIVSQREMYLFLVQNVPDATRPPRERMPELLRAELEEYEGHVAWVRDRIVDPERVDYRPLEVVLVEPPWHRGRVVLVGDAAHATTPHLAAGAMCAMEDGIVLAELLQEDAPLEDVLRRFVARRYERCKLVVENAVQLGEWEKDADDPTADPVGLTESTWAQLARPI